MRREVFELNEQFPCREREVEKLYQLYGRDDEVLIESLYVFGVTSTGKTALVGAALRKFKLKCAIVDLIRCNTTKLLLENIVEQFKEGTSTKCDSLMDFIVELRQNCENEIPKVIILDKAERLRDMDVNLLPAFLRLRELTSLNISVIFISTLEFSKIIQKVHVSAPLTLHFRQYSRDEILKILMLDSAEIISNLTAPDEDASIFITGDFYKNYLNVMLSVFYRNCRDLNELRHQARLHFSKYCEPVIKSEIAPNDVSKLWHNIASTLKAGLESVYMRTSVESHQNVNASLPFYAKYLLIAGYLASYNPAKEDKRLFTKDHGRKRKTLGHMQKNNKVSELLNTQLGPKPFTLDRLLAIFFSILDEKAGLSASLMSQLSSLVQMQLLAKIGEDNNLDGQKFKCNVDLEHIQLICKMVGFNIRKYLFDFM